MLPEEEEQDAVFRCPECREFVSDKETGGMIIEPMRFAWECPCCRKIFTVIIMFNKERK